MRIQRFLQFLQFVNNFPVNGANTFLLLLILHLLFYHNQFCIKKLKWTVNPFMLKNLQSKISFFSMIFWTLRISLKRGMKWSLVIILAKNLISNGGKLSVQFLKLNVNTPISRIYFKKDFLSMIFSGKTYTLFSTKSL